MLISELTVYDFLKDKIKLSDSDAKRYAKEMASVGEKIDIQLDQKIKDSDYVTKTYLDIKVSQLELKIEKGFKEIIMWVIGFMVAIATLSIAIMKVL